MKLSHLRTLVTIVEEGSLSAAARVMRISQPAVTKQLQRMEADIGLALLVRGPQRQVELTPAGERMLAFARETLSQFNTLREELAMLKKIGRGALTLAASTIPGEHVLPELLASFRKEHPQVEVRMTISDTSDVATKLLKAEADVGVIGSAPKRSGLRLEPLVEDEIVLVVPSDHPFAEREQVELEELSGQPLILREEGSGTRRSVEASLKAAGGSLPVDNVIMILGSTQAVLHAAEQGLGIGFVSARASAQAQAGGRLVSVGLTGVDLGRELYLACLPQRSGDPLVAHFLDFARSQFAG
ncbi:MAG: LysR family transcriptional regulator [Anaerolineae bacterium]|jgi:DNA-binding transcriptional LysR family regulator